MKRGITLLVLLLCVVYAQAQSDFAMMMNKEGKVYMMPKRPTFNLVMPAFSYKMQTPTAALELNSRMHDFMPSDVPSVADRPMDMQILSTAYQPFFNVFTPMLRRVSPVMLDFNESVFAPVGDNFMFVVNGQQNTWPGAGGVTFLSSSAVWHKDRWMLAGGAFGGRFYTPFNASPGFMGGFNLNASYEVTDWMKIRGWGQYANYADNNKNSFILLNPSFQQTSVGGAVEFKIKDGFGVGAGLNYQYNPFRKKMEQQILVYPIFSR